MSYKYNPIRRGLTFEQWKYAVNTIVEARAGLSADDLPDWDYRGSFDNGESASTAARKAIAAAKEF
jgi:hypothetical protein